VRKLTFIANSDIVATLALLKALDQSELLIDNWLVAILAKFDSNSTHN
jgi:hypothetical protein